MKRLYEKGIKGSRGLAMLLSALLIFSMVFSGSLLQVHADPETIYTCSLTVDPYEGEGSVMYIDDSEDPQEHNVSASGGTFTNATAIVFRASEGWHVSELVYNGNTIDNPPNNGNYDFDTEGPKSFSITFEEDEQSGTDPEPTIYTCSLEISSYDTEKGFVRYFNANDVEQTASANGGTVQAKSVSFGANQGWRVSQVVYNGTTYNDPNTDHFDFESEGNKTFSITFAENTQGGTDPAICIRANSYDNTNGNIQYSVDGNTWENIPAAGLASDTEAAFIKAVPASGYGVSYKIDGNVITDTNSHGLSDNPVLHYIQDIAFTSTTKSLTVSAYSTTGGTIKYSADGENWSDVPAAGGTVRANYVKAIANSGYTLDSYTLNSHPIYEQSSQTLTEDSNTISSVSFISNNGGGQYFVWVDDQTGGQCTATVTFLDSSGTSLGNASTGSNQDIPAATARIRITISNKELLKSIQIFRNAAPAAPGSAGATEIARPSIEEGLWRSANGTVEFSASYAYSYRFAIELSNTKNVGWSYKESDRGTDRFVEHCRLYLLDDSGNRRDLIDESDGNRATTDYASYNLTIGQTYRFELVPDYGYQIAGLSINGYTVAPTDDTGVFSFTMTNSNFHFRGVVSSADDIVNAPAAYNGARITGGSNAASSGNVRMTITNTATDNSAAAVAGEGATAVATVDIDLDKVVSKGNGQYWSDSITSISNNVMVSLPVSASGLQAGETYSVVRNHNGTKTELAATYNSTTGMLTFGSNRFSDYTIVKKAGTPQTGSETSGSSSSGASTSGDSSDDDDVSSNAPVSSSSSSGFMGVVDNTATITSWNELDNVLKADGNLSVLGAAGAAASAATGNGALNGNNKAAGNNIVSVLLSGSKIVVPASTFTALDNSKVDGLHVFTNNGIALTFLKNTTKKKQDAVDIAATVTKGKSFTRIAFKKPQVLNAVTALHTTVPKGTKVVRLYVYGPDGKKYFVRELTPLADGQVAFLISSLGTYELDY